MNNLRNLIVIITSLKATYSLQHIYHCWIFFQVVLQSDHPITHFPNLNICNVFCWFMVIGITIVPETWFNISSTRTLLVSPPNSTLPSFAVSQLKPCSMKWIWPCTTLSTQVFLSLSLDCLRKAMMKKSCWILQSCTRR